MKLLQQVFWNEGEWGVFRRANGVVGVSPIWMMLGFNTGWHNVIRYDRAHPWRLGSFCLSPEKKPIYPWDSRLSNRVNRFSSRGLA